MAKILTIKIDKEGGVDIKPHKPEGMSAEQVLEKLDTALPLAIAFHTMTAADRSVLEARAKLLDIFEKADDLISKINDMNLEEDCDECPVCRKADDDCDH